MRNRIDLRWRFVIAVALEVCWEMLENTPAIIERYRTSTIALGYTGDSVVNSISDVAACAIGFWIASTLRWPGVVGLFVLAEIFMLWVYRDNLTLNVLMLAWPLETVKSWQLGG